MAKAGQVSSIIQGNYPRKFGDVNIGVYYDGIVDNSDPGKDKDLTSTGRIFSSIQNAITAGKKSIFVRGTTADAADITIASGDSPTLIFGENTQTSIVPVNIICNKADVAFQNLWFQGKTLYLAGARDIGFACLFSGATANDTATLNIGTATKTITNATNATPIVITSTAHGYSNGDGVTVASVGGNTAANGTWIVQNVAANTFELMNSVGNGAYTSGGTARKDLGINTTSLPFNGGTNNGMLPFGIAGNTYGHFLVDNEVISYSAGGAASSGTLTLATGSGSTHGMIETLATAHADGATITSMDVANCVVDEADVQLISCRWVGCSNPNVPALMVKHTAPRTKITACAFLSNTTWCCIALAQKSSSANQPQEVQIVGNVFDSNTVYSQLIENWSVSQQSGNEVRFIAMNGNTFRTFHGGCVRVIAGLCNISGNIFDGGAKNTQTMAINNGGAAITANQTTIPYNSLSGTGTLANKGMVVIENEMILYSAKTATNLLGCVRGANATTAATHADTTTITNTSQRVFSMVGGGAAAMALLINQVSGNTIDSVMCTNIEITNYSWNGTTKQAITGTGFCKMSFATNAVSRTTIFYLGNNYGVFENAWTLPGTIDVRSSSGVVIFGGQTGWTISNIGTDTMVLTGGAAPTGFSTGFMLSKDKQFALGRVAGNLTNICIPMTNQTAATSVVGDVVTIQLVTNNYSFLNNAGANSTAVCGVVMEAVAAGADALICISGIATITCETAGAVARGDLLVTAATAGTAKTNNAAAVGAVIGKALTAKAAATSGSVVALIGI